MSETVFDIDRVFAATLKRLRKERGLSQEEFAASANIHRTYVSQLERGLKSPSLKTLHKIASVLNLKLSTFIKVMEEEDAHVSS